MLKPAHGARYSCDSIGSQPTARATPRRQRLASGSRSHILGGVDEAIPVDVYVPGCPPRPEAVIHGVAILLKQLQPHRSTEIDQLEAEMGILNGKESAHEHAELLGAR